MTVLVVGTGRVAGALARALADLGELSAVAGRDPAQAAALADGCGVPALTVAQAAPWAARHDALVVVAVSDDAIPTVAEALADGLRAATPTDSATHPVPRGTVVHCSGATGRAALAPLAELGWTTGCWHPFQAFSTREARLAPGTLCTVTAPEPLAGALLALTCRLGCTPGTVREEDRAAYHAAASIAVHGAVAGLWQGEALLRACGLGDASTTALTSLVRGTFDAADAVGTAQALSGPIVRGDRGTLVRHREALAGATPPRDETLAFYTAAARAVVPVLEARGMPEDVIRVTLSALTGTSGSRHPSQSPTLDGLSPTPGGPPVQLKTMVSGKIHRARVTAADLHYVGSITIDEDLLDAAGIDSYERVQVVDIDNGNRLETYTIPGERGSGEIQLNGAAARLVQPGDLVIVMAYQQVTVPVPADWHPRVVLVEPSDNSIAEVITTREHPKALRGPMSDEALRAADTLSPEADPEVASAEHEG